MESKFRYLILSCSRKDRKIVFDFLVDLSKFICDSAEKFEEKNGFEYYCHVSDYFHETYYDNDEFMNTSTKINEIFCIIRQFIKDNHLQFYPGAEAGFKTSNMKQTLLNTLLIFKSIYNLYYREFSIISDK